MKPPPLPKRGWDISKIKTRNVALIAFGIFVVSLAIQKPNSISNKPVAQTAAPTSTPALRPTPALAAEPKSSAPLDSMAVKPTVTPAYDALEKRGLIKNS
jgi:hypothetical protein